MGGTGWSWRLPVAWFEAYLGELACSKWRKLTRATTTQGMVKFWNGAALCASLWWSLARCRESYQWGRILKSVTICYSHFLKFSKFNVSLWLNGALGGTRTPDTLVRSQFDQDSVSMKSVTCDVTNQPITAYDCLKQLGLYFTLLQICYTLKWGPRNSLISMLAVRKFRIVYSTQRSCKEVVGQN